MLNFPTGHNGSLQLLELTPVFFLPQRPNKNTTLNIKQFNHYVVRLKSLDWCQVVSGCCKSQEWITDDGGYILLYTVMLTDNDDDDDEM